ncbi:repressor of RNA polymerase III transcription MAF1 homolog [Adelges cooleyi]|uniref:repressor of RNA polymerase III transcription MAF1 homolog n=1 Tax=Adelges cooleyi TaxID=133065 RepID=UPI0021808C16|nr:repressor of RNA polymerase III transcription MAF1 homolog [Adelges cooleyi]XP_050434066.1 repressor of RNA polymerase III transcription MAF1 homolog [Adelges cooleyi]XP_050439580.1 repressor of RNA polymerase III transcription MAF1 homolog [Adelges cooleyi]XP_050439581.1 repressor of RNA polymerase III transcription MAF1 homolog [Adelges cooleyi]
MKLLESSQLNALSQALCVDRGDEKVIARIESYSCKMVGDEKQQYKKFYQESGTQPNDLEALSSPSDRYNGGRSLSVSGDDGDQLCDTISRKSLFYLIATLNATFAPDYDFTDAKSSEFSRERSLQWVMRDIDNNLSAVIVEPSSDGKSDVVQNASKTSYGQIRHALWEQIDKEIGMSQCDIYSYTPDMRSDPFSEDGCLWSFNYFFYNKKLKRILFFTCRRIVGSCYPMDFDGSLHSDEMLMHQYCDGEADTSYRHCHSRERSPLTSRWIDAELQ